MYNWHFQPIPSCVGVVSLDGSGVRMHYPASLSAPNLIFKWLQALPHIEAIFFPPLKMLFVWEKCNHFSYIPSSVFKPSNYLNKQKTISTSPELNSGRKRITKWKTDNLCFFLHSWRTVERYLRAHFKFFTTM